MKKIELFASLAIIISLVLKQFNLPYGGVILTISIISLASYYMFYYLGSSQELALRLRKLLFKEDLVDTIEVKISGMAIPTVLIAVLFEFMHYPFSHTLFLVGLVAISIALIITGYKYLRTKSTSLYQLSLRLILIGGMGVLVLLSSTNRGENMEDKQSDTIETNIVE